MDMVNKCQCGFETPLAKCPKCGVALVEPSKPKPNALGQSAMRILGALLALQIVGVFYWIVTNAH